MEDVLERFTVQICTFVTQESKEVKGQLVKKHNENISTHGDFSFPNSIKSWHEYGIYNKVVDKDNVTLLEAISKQPSDIVEESKSWDISVKNVNEENGRIYMFLDRPRTIRVGFVEALHNNEVVLQKMNQGYCKVVMDPLCEGNCDLTTLRTNYLCNVIKNLCAIREVDSAVFVTWKSTSKSDGSHTVLCGSVLNAKAGAKETKLTSKDFTRLRQDEMTLIAQHKYGLRVATDCKWIEFTSHLGESAAAFELLQTKPSGAVKINFDCSSLGSSKGASFILYNCARLETIIKTYSEQVDEGVYPELPPSDDVDYTLLTQEEEWCLIFTYILGLPALLKTSVEVNEHNCEFRPHFICSYLCSLVRVFSQYYRRVRILVEPRKHLLPVIFARMHMLKILNDILKTCLKILNIKSVSQM